MSYFGTSCESRLKSIERERDDLQWQLDEQRERENRRQEAEAREREEARRQAQSEREEQLRDVSDWPQAFSTGLYLIANERREEERDNAAYANEPDYKPQHWFADWEKEVSRARDLYNETMVEVDKQIELIRAAALNTVADKLAAEFEHGGGGSGTVQALRENNPAYLTQW